MGHDLADFAHACGLTTRPAAIYRSPAGRRPTSLVRKPNLAVASRQVADKRRMAAPVPGGTHEVDVPRFLREQPVLEEGQLVEAAHLALDLEQAESSPPPLNPRSSAPASTRDGTTARSCPAAPFASPRAAATGPLQGRDGNKTHFLRYHLRVTFVGNSELRLPSNEIEQRSDRVVRKHTYRYRASSS